MTSATPRPAPADRSDAVLSRLQLLVTRKLDGLLQGDYVGLLPGPGSEAGSRASTAPATTYAGWTGP